ncbi:hypothetical protein V6N11_065268 [Hibiscus sabdariffa]|uniref:Uncharacterized protein n=1 Tax=Hibiscus sabdariffa TaxID=183260 RepID=A0ABR2QGG1_9ROSI
MAMRRKFVVKVWSSQILRRKVSNTSRVTKTAVNQASGSRFAALEEAVDANADVNGNVDMSSIEHIGVHGTVASSSAGDEQFLVDFHPDEMVEGAECVAHDIDLEQDLSDGVEFQFVAVYASPNVMKHKYLWKQLCDLNLGDELTWILGGDFNVILSAEERCGRLYERLDRSVMNSKWKSIFMEAHVLHLDKLGSDHGPLVLRLSEDQTYTRDRPFHFVNAWQEHPQFSDLLKSVWNNGEPLESNMGEFRRSTIGWNWEVFGNIHTRKNRIMRRLWGIDRALARHHSKALVLLAKKLNLNLKVFWNKRRASGVRKHVPSG